MSEFSTTVQLGSKEVLVIYKILSGKIWLKEVDGHTSIAEIYTINALRIIENQVNFHHSTLSQCLR